MFPSALADKAWLDRAHTVLQQLRYIITLLLSLDHPEELPCDNPASHPFGLAV